MVRTAPTAGDDLVDEGRPLVGPFLPQDAHQHQIELVQQRALLAQTLFSAAVLDDAVDDEVADAHALIAGQHLPARQDHVIQDLQAQELGLRVFRILQDLIDEQPRVWGDLEFVEPILCLLLSLCTVLGAGGCLVEGACDVVQLFNTHGSHVCGVGVERLGVVCRREQSGGRLGGV